jgi:probable O-glycosylation ligase (exosortase A-associated)
MKDFIFVLLFLPFIYLALRNPFLGLCGWIWTIMAIPKNMLWGFAGDIRFTYILAISTIIGMFFQQDPFRKSPLNGYFWLLLIFLIQTALSNTFTMGTPLASWLVWSDFFKAVVLTVLCMMLLNTQNRIETFLFALLMGVGFNIFFEGMKFLVTLGNYKIVGIKHSMMTDNNLFALAILMVIPLYLYLIPQLKNKLMKWFYTALAGLAAVCVIGSYSRGGFVGLVIESWQVFLKIKRKFLFIIFSIMFVSTAVYVASDKWADRIKTIENAEQDHSFLGRVTAWKLATLGALDHPILGTGQDSMQHYHVWNYYYDDIHKFDFITPNNTSRDYPKAAHSIYFQVLGDAGFVGLGLFLLILSRGYFLSKKLAKTGNELWIQQLSKSINTILIVFMVSGSLLSLAYYDLLYVLIALLYCLDHINRTSVEK